jgi:hypothetical protein
MCIPTKHAAHTPACQSSRYQEHTCLSCVWKVLGSIFGNKRRATGSKSSAKGMMMKSVKGTIRKMSAVVRVSCLRSRLVRLSPCSCFHTSLVATLSSKPKSLKPTCTVTRIQLIRCGATLSPIYVVARSNRPPVHTADTFYAVRREKYMWNQAEWFEGDSRRHIEACVPSSGELHA